MLTPNNISDVAIATHRESGEEIHVRYVGLDEDIPFIDIYEDIETGMRYRDDELLLNVDKYDDTSDLFVSLKEVNDVLKEAITKNAISEDVKNFIIERLLKNICPF